MESSSAAFPVWAISLIVVLLIIILIAIAILFMRKRRIRSLSIDTIHRLDQPETEATKKKKPISAGSIQTVVTSEQNNISSLTKTPLPQVPSGNIQNQVLTPQQQNEKTDRPASAIDESDFSNEPPKPSQEITISLPLPPPSASFFSDKMELGGDHGQDFYDMYLNSSKISTKDQEGSGFMSIDVDVPSIYSNVQQKAATIKSSLRQSLKMSPKPKQNSVFQTFSGSSSALKVDEQISTIESNHSSHFSALEKPSITATASTKTIIEMDQYKQQTSTKQSFSRIDVTPQKQPDNQSLTVEDEDESPITPNLHLQEPVRAAKRVIRSASKKTKRSIATPEPTTEEDAENDENKRSKHGSIRSKHGSIRYASTRGPKNASGEHMTITSGSMRRLVRESILFDDDVLPSIPVASSAAMASTHSTQRKSNAGISAEDIAGWWDNSTPSKSINSDSNATSNTDYNSNESTISGVESTSSQNTPNQYRASLNKSIFAFNATISKAGGSNTSFFNDGTKGDSNNEGVSRHSSFRRGTLGRNTLRSITANATRGVNRSLKGLFDYSSSNSLSNKVVPDDSQKMELDSEPTVDFAEEKVAVVGQQNFGSMRQKNVRASTSNNTRPSLPTAYLPTSESSTKYAFSDEDEEIMLSTDESSKKTAIEDVPQPLTKLIATTNDRKPYTQMTSSSITSRRVNDSPVPLTPVPGNVDNIRRMLQDTWIANSTSTYSMVSEADSIATTSTTQSTKVYTRQQNQSLLTKSLLTQQVTKRASLLAQHQDNNGRGCVPLQQGPDPSASFSSSTVRTVLPTNETPQTEPIAMRQNAITQYGSNKIQQQQPQSSSYESQTTVLMMGSPRNSSAESGRGHSRKSSGGNSAATALRISGGGYAINAKTWNGRAQQKRSSRASVTQQSVVSAEADEDEVEFYGTLGSSVNNKRAFFSTMRKGQKTRGHIPWMNDEEEEERERTPAQIERDRYLEKKA